MERKTHFRFKKFTVAHGRSTMKVGTDAVLLGAWVHVRNAQQILDIGTGSGTIALMLAQRSVDTGATIDAVEIEETDALQAKENFTTSPWSSRIHLHHVAIQQFRPYKYYDVIVSNPPYFNNSQKPPDTKRHQARHTVTLPYDELIAATLRLLYEDGSFNVILPFTEGLHFIDVAKQHGLFCSRQFSFRSKAQKPIERLLLEFRKTENTIETGEIVLYQDNEKWSDEYIRLTSDFYLKL
jgi:tRNA1Val (adenine37-N6)-methyltransferase